MSSTLPSSSCHGPATTVADSRAPHGSSARLGVCTPLHKLCFSPFSCFVLPAMPPKAHRRHALLINAKTKAKAASRAKAVAQARAKQPALSRAVAKAKAAACAQREAKKAQNQVLRRGAVRDLNTLAIAVGAHTLRPKSAPWEKVERLIGILDGRCQVPEQRAALRVAAQQWVAGGGRLAYGLVDEPDSRADDEAPPVLPSHKIIKKGFRIRTHAFMLTYNSDRFTEETWGTYGAWVRALAKQLGAHAWAACIEKSLHSAGPAPRYHLHGYLLWKGGDGFNRRNTDELVFDGVPPRVDVCTRSNPARLHAAALQGLHYVSTMKMGTLATDMNFKPWRDYTPKADWVDSLWSAHKLSHAQYARYSEELRCGHAKRRRDVEDVMRSERERAIDEHLQNELDALEKIDPDLPMRDFPALTAFVESLGKPARRRPVLVIVGGTNLGKSMLAASVLRRVATTLGLPGFLEVTVEGDTFMDLAEFDLMAHAGVLLDGVGDVTMLKRHREVLQGRIKKCRGGKSATMMYSYPFTLCRRAVVVTLDLEAKNLHLLATDHWLSNPKNVVLIRLSGPAWESEGPIAQSPADPIVGWSVGAVASWLEDLDMCGPAATLRAQGVSGADLMAFQSPAELARDLGTTPFVAKKVLRLRDQHAPLHA